MNISLSLKKFSKISNHVSNIGYRMHKIQAKAKEKQQRHRERLNLSNDQIKYLDKVVVLEGGSYSVNGRSFSRLEKTLDYCKQLPIERCRKIWGAGITISIINPNAPKVFDCSCLPAGLLVKDSKHMYASQ